MFLTFFFFILSHSLYIGINKRFPFVEITKCVLEICGSVFGCENGVVEEVFERLLKFL